MNVALFHMFMTFMTFIPLSDGCAHPGFFP